MIKSKVRIKSIDSLLKLIPTTGRTYFRGQKNGFDNGWNLKPGFYRNSFNMSFTIKQEYDIFYKILEKQPHYFKNTNNLLDIINILQHNNFPTRVIDLTTNPLIALYFALDGYNGESDQPVIFIIEATTGSNISSSKIINEKIENFYRDSENKVNTVDCVLVNGVNFHDKIKNQSGDFVFFFKDVCLSEQNEYKIIEVEIDKNYIEQITEQLSKIGITKNTIYPSLSNSIIEMIDIEKSINSMEVLKRSISTGIEMLETRDTKFLEKVKIAVENSKNSTFDNELALLKDDYFKKKIDYAFEQNKIEEINKYKQIIIKQEKLGNIKVFWADNKVSLILFII